MANYDTIDYDWSWDGDVAPGDDGDIKDTSYDYLQSLRNEIATVSKNAVGDMKDAPNYAASLDDYIGAPNTRETGKAIEQRLVSALVSNGVVARSDLQVKVVPIGLYELLIMVRVQVIASAQNGLSQGTPVLVALLYDTNEDHIFFLPANATERLGRGF